MRQAHPNIIRLNSKSRPRRIVCVCLCVMRKSKRSICKKKNDKDEFNNRLEYYCFDLSIGWQTRNFQCWVFVQARAQRSRMFISFPVCLFSMYIEIECNDAGVNRSYLPFVLIARKVFNYRHHNDDEENREQKKQIVNKKSIQTIRETIFIHVFLLNCFSNSSLSLCERVPRT